MWEVAHRGFEVVLVSLTMSSNNLSDKTSLLSERVEILALFRASQYDRFGKIVYT